MTTTLPDRVVLPLGRAVARIWSPADAQDIVTVAVPGGTVGLNEEEATLWREASAGLSKARLLEQSAVDGPGATYDQLARWGLIVEVPTDGPTLLREAAGLRLLAHSPVGVLPGAGPVVGDPDGEYVVLSPAVHEVYCWSAPAHTLAAAVGWVAAQASEAGVNDLDVILPDRLVQRSLAELLPLVNTGLASLTIVKGQP